MSKENPVNRLLDAIEKTTLENGCNQGKAFIQTVFQDVTQGANPPLKNEDGDNGCVLTVHHSWDGTAHAFTGGG